MQLSVSRGLKPLVVSAAAIIALGLFESPVKAQTSETCFHSTVGGTPITTPMCFVAEAHSGTNEVTPDIGTKSQNSASDAVTPSLSHSDPIPPALEPPPLTSTMLIRSGSSDPGHGN
jgi:hypothetical protein